MNSINFYKVGYFRRTHGINGRLLLQLESEMPENIEEMELFFVEIDKKPVPFFISTDGITVRNHSSLIVALDDVDDEKKATDLIGKQVFLDQHLCEFQEEEEDTSNPEGYTIYDANNVRIGVVFELMDIPENPLFRILEEGREILIPVNDEWILEMDDIKKILKMDLPEGLLDI